MRIFVTRLPVISGLLVQCVAPRPNAQMFAPFVNLQPNISGKRRSARSVCDCERMSKKLELEALDSMIVAFAIEEPNQSSAVCHQSERSSPKEMSVFSHRPTSRQALSWMQLEVHLVSHASARANARGMSRRSVDLASLNLHLPPASPRFIDAMDASSSSCWQRAFFGCEICFQTKLFPAIGLLQNWS
jgi:hypothetical protein